MMKIGILCMEFNRSVSNKHSGMSLASISQIYQVCRLMAINVFAFYWFKLGVFTKPWGACEETATLWFVLNWVRGPWYVMREIPEFELKVYQHLIKPLGCNLTVHLGRLLALLSILVFNWPCCPTHLFHEVDSKQSHAEVQCIID